MVLLSAFGGYLLVTNYAMAHYVTGINEWPCPFSHWSLWLAFPLFLFPFPVRALQLYLVFKRNVDKVKNHVILQAKTEQRVTIVEQRFSMSANGQSGGGDDIQKAIEHHKQKKAQQKTTKKKNVTIEEHAMENAVVADEGKEAAAETGTANASPAGEQIEGPKGIQKLIMSFLPLKKKNSSKNVRKTVRISELAAAESGIINTQTNRGN